MQWLGGGEFNFDSNVGAVVNGEMCFTAVPNSMHQGGAVDLFSLDAANRKITMVCDIPQFENVTRCMQSLDARSKCTDPCGGRTG